MVSMTTADQALKTVYLGAISQQMNTEVNPLLAKIKQSTEDVWGKDVKRLVQYGVNGGVGAGTETGDLPAAGGNNYKQLTTTLKNLYGTISLSDKAIRASQNNAGAFVNLLTAEMDGLVKASSFNFGRMLFGDGTGVLATVEGISGLQITLNSVKNLAVGMTVDFKDPSTGETITGANARRIIDVDPDKKTIEVSGAILTSSTVPAGTIIAVQGSYGRELTGLGAIFKKTGTIYGVDRSKNKWLVPYIKEEVGEISEAEIQKAIDHIEENTGGKINFIVCSSGVKRAFQNHLATFRRNTDVMELAGGYKAISYNGIPIVSDRFCPEGTMYLLNTDDFTLHQLCDWKWLESEDGKVLKQIAGTPTYTATLVKYADLICTKPCGQAMLKGITEA
ncbi:MAG: phage major capsid protein [Clostridia bacterium]|nr:phage major capsid protein [Clostridia bacterium]